MNHCILSNEESDGWTSAVDFNKVGPEVVPDNDDGKLKLWFYQSTQSKTRYQRRHSMIKKINFIT